VKWKQGKLVRGLTNGMRTECLTGERHWLKTVYEAECNHKSDPSKEEMVPARKYGPALHARWGSEKKGDMVGRASISCGELAKISNSTQGISKKVKKRIKIILFR
jgi:hypothetical protein